MCLELVQHVIDRQMFGLFLIPPEFEDLVVRSWDEDEPTIYGRFDLAFDGVGPPKLLEYNADTPTALVEAAVAQWFWLKDVDERGDQFNSIHERLIEAWKAVREKDDRPIHFAALSGIVEDYITVEYLRDTAIQAGFETEYLDVEQIGWDRDRRVFVDRQQPADRADLQALPVGVDRPRRVRQERPRRDDAVDRAGLEDDPELQVDPADAVRAEPGLAVPVAGVVRAAGRRIGLRPQADPRPRGGEHPGRARRPGRARDGRPVQGRAVRLPAARPAESRTTAATR